MSLNKKIAIFLILFTSILVISIAIVLVFSFRNYSKRNVIDKADVIANIVKDGLTIHMENNIVDKRYIFLSKIRDIEAVKNLKVLRSKKVDELFKTDIYRFQKIDPLEKDVLKNGRKKYKIVESLNKAILKIAIPYIASSYEMPNCLKCHTNAKEGDVLGVISMEFDITNIREYSLLTIGKIVALIFTVFIIA
ncbi:MAG TPA: GGDEF domain-containing protein, partial [Campylobacterales bacterium]|nr:GGDEF domain-containing protein [Campylobacterales bacterium]